jgi:hypothetical protein
VARDWVVLGRGSGTDGIAAFVATGLLAQAGPAIAAIFDLSDSGVLDTGDGPGGLRRGGELMREMGVRLSLEALIPSATLTSDVR